MVVKVAMVVEMVMLLIIVFFVVTGSIVGGDRGRLCLGE